MKLIIPTQSITWVSLIYIYLMKHDWTKIMPYILHRVMFKEQQMLTSGYKLDVLFLERYFIALICWVKTCCCISCNMLVASQLIWKTKFTQHNICTSLSILFVFICCYFFFHIFLCTRWVFFREEKLLPYVICQHLGLVFYILLINYTVATVAYHCKT